MPDIQPATEPTSPRLEKRRIALQVMVFALVAGLLQLLGDIPFDADSAYHVAVARLTVEHGILKAFPWTPFSWLATHYADKEFLFHVLMVPFAGFEWTTTARVTGTLMGTFALTALYAVLRAERVKMAGLWPLAMLAGSSWFAMRFTLVRAHVLAIGLSVLVTWALARRRWGLLFLCSLLYPLTYTAWHTVIALALVVEAARVLGGRRPEPWGLGVALLGLTAGLLIHPNFPEIFRLFWIQNVQVLFGTAWSSREGIDLGTEFQALAPEAWLRFSSLPYAMAVAGAVLAWRQRRQDVLPIAFALVALAFGVMTLRTSRFIEYLAPFAAGSLALGLRGSMRVEPITGAVVVGAMVWTAVLGRGPLEQLARRGEDMPEVIAEKARAAIPEKSQVFTCDWGMTGALMLALPERQFMVALDPVFFSANDPVRYRKWYGLVKNPPEDAARQIREDFHAGFVMCFFQREHWPLFKRLEADPSVTPVLRTPLWFLYRLNDPVKPAQEGGQETGGKGAEPGGNGAESAGTGQSPL